LEWLSAAGESGTTIAVVSGVVVGAVAVVGGAGVAGASWVAGTVLVVARSKNRSSSTGKGITNVLFFSAATSTTVCSSLSCSAPGGGGHGVGGVGEPGGGLELAVGGDHPGAAFAFGFGLA
jgi:hypothetical protein